MSWLQKIKSKFIDDCKEWYKLWSSWLAFAWGLIVLVFWNAPETLNSLVQVLPDETRAILSPVVLGIVAGLPILVRLLKQQKLKSSSTDDTASEQETGSA